MKDSFEISTLARMLAKTGENIEALVQATTEADRQVPELADLYEEMALDELSHVQMMTLELTKLLVHRSEEDAAVPEQAVEMDGDGGSVFAEGDLDFKKSKEPEDDTGKETP